jgi:hypothetical protein
MILAGVLISMFLNQRAEAVAGLGFIAVGGVVYAAIRPPRQTQADASFSKTVQD